MARGVRSEGVSVLWRTSVRTSNELAGMFATLANEAGFEVSVSDYVPEPIDLGFGKVVPGNLSKRNGVPFGDGEFDLDLDRDDQQPQPIR